MNDKLQGERELPAVKIRALGHARLMHESDTQKELLCFYPQDFEDAVAEVLFRAALTSDAEPVATIVTDRYGVYVKDLRWHKKLDLPDGDYPLYLAPPSTAQAVEAASNSWRKVAAEAFEAWDSDNDSRLGKLLRAMSDPVFARQYRKDIAALHDTPAIPTEAAQVERDAKDAERYRGAISREDTAEALYGAVLSHVGDKDVVDMLVDAAIDSAKREG